LDPVVPGAIALSDNRDEALIFPLICAARCFVAACASEEPLYLAGRRWASGNRPDEAQQRDEAIRVVTGEAFEE
jgi:hypothetical protein